MTRTPLWAPEWTESLVGWTMKYIRKHKWRVDLSDFEDLLHDAWLVFHRVKISYPRVVDPPHFMALYQMALANEFANLSNYKKYKHAAIEGTDGRLHHHAAEFSHEGYLRASINRLPADVKKALTSLTDPDKRQAILSKRGKKSLNIAFSKAAGLTRRVDVVSHLKEALSP